MACLASTARCSSAICGILGPPLTPAPNVSKWPFATYCAAARSRSPCEQSGHGLIAFGSVPAAVMRVPPYECPTRIAGLGGAAAGCVADDETDTNNVADQNTVSGPVRTSNPMPSRATKSAQRARGSAAGLAVFQGYMSLLTKKLPPRVTLSTTRTRRQSQSSPFPDPGVMSAGHLH